MKVFTFIVLFILLASNTLHAQGSFSIRGTVIDSSLNEKIRSSGVCILNAKDSILRAFTWTNDKGDFTIPNLTGGKYLLLITYPGYADHIEYLDPLDKNIDFGNIKLLLKSQLLAEVVIRAKKSAVTIKGDTTEYNAGSFKVEANARVEDLLKQMPGIQVDKDGRITAKGVRVNKVLIDGEEFFGDDPTLVTKNVRADMVDKVQLYDKKSDQATLTGIDDNKKERTINLVLKENKKNGYFGKIRAGGGTHGYYQNEALFNVFDGKQKLGLYGTLANDGKTTLGWDDNTRRSLSSNDPEFLDGNGINGGFEDMDDPEIINGQYVGKGRPITKTGGAHYDTKWNSGNDVMNVDYKISALNVDGSQNTLSQNNLPNGLINSTNENSFKNSFFGQKLDGQYRKKIDSTESLKIVFYGNLKDQKSADSYLATSGRQNDILLNQSDRDINNQANERRFHGTAYWLKKLKKGRSLSIFFDDSYEQRNANEYLNSSIKYYSTLGELDSTQLISQFQKIGAKSSIIKSNLNYSQVFTPKFSVIVNYGIEINNSKTERTTFNPSPSGAFDILNNALSNSYVFNQLYNGSGAVFYYKTKKASLVWGTKVALVNFTQINEYDRDKLKRNFINWKPQLEYNYRITKQSSLQFNYTGQTIQPTINQLQPVKVNNDPLNIVLGNPDLKPSFTHQINASFSSYKEQGEEFLMINGFYNFTTNAIINNVTTDSVGKSVYQFLNFKNRLPAAFFLGVDYRKRLTFPEMNVGVSSQANGNTFYNLTNGVINETRLYNYSLSVNGSNFKNNRYSFNASLGPMYTVSQSSLQKINNNGFGLNGSANLRVFLPGRIQLSSDCDYQYRAKTPSFNEDLTKFIWNAHLKKSFFKNNDLTFMIEGYDLLDQNKGFYRSAYSNLITQTTYSTIRRYFMFSLSWDLNKMGISSPQTKIQ